MLTTPPPSAPGLVRPRIRIEKPEFEEISQNHSRQSNPAPNGNSIIPRWFVWVIVMTYLAAAAGISFVVLTLV